MTFSRRLVLYLIGIGIGSVAAWFIFGERLANKGWTPKERIKKRIHATLVKQSTQAQQQLAAWPADLVQVRAAVPTAEVLLDETRRRNDSLFYTLDAEVAGKPARMVFSVMDRYERDTSAVLMVLMAR